MTAEAEGTGEAWIALGITLRLLTTAEGGRTKDVGVPGSVYERFRYRPNWGLPGMSGTDQVGAFVLWLSPFPLGRGHTAGAAIVPLDPGSLPLWKQVHVGDELRMFEGPRVCGRATVDKVWVTAVPLPEADSGRFIEWVDASDGGP